VAAVTALSATTATFAASSPSQARHSAGTARAHHKKHPAPRNGPVSPALRSAFGVFRLPAQSTTAGTGAESAAPSPGTTTAPPLPAEIAREMVAGGNPYQLDLAATHGFIVSGQPVWVIPGATGGCITNTAIGATGHTFYPAGCGQTANLEAGTLVGAAGPGQISLAHTTAEANAIFTLVGLAPDANGNTVTALEPDGTELALPVIDNIYVWKGPGSMLPDSVTVVGTNGRATTNTIVPAPA